MSVSRRSPTTSGADAPTRRAAVCISAGAGLPATCGSSRVAVRRTATSDPLPGSGPRSLGSVGSTLHATHTAPARNAMHASASVAYRSWGSRPWTTAVAPAAVSVGVSPTAEISATSAAVPTTSTFAPSGSCSASSAAAAWELVATSSASAG